MTLALLGAHVSILHRFILNLWEDFRTDKRPLVSPRVHDHKTSAYPDVSLQVTLSGGLALAAAVDACIAGLTIYYLRQSQAAFKAYVSTCLFSISVFTQTLFKERRA